MAKIAVDLEHALARRRAHGGAGQTAGRVIARGNGWSVADVVCTCGPQDRPYEEQHGHYAIAIVLSGSFQYRSSAGRGLMTAGSALLGNPGQCFECAHEHGEGDRCVSFWYAADLFERWVGDAVPRGAGVGFTVPRLPPVRPVSWLAGRATAGLLNASDAPWEELAVRLAVQATRLTAGGSPEPHDVPLNAEARVTRIVRFVDRHPDAVLNLAALARESGLSPYYFLRTFERVTGVTPHQYVLRARLREAATRLAIEPAKVLDIALDCGFGDVSNFNRAFRTEFGVSPREYRRSVSGSGTRDSGSGVHGSGSARSAFGVHRSGFGGRAPVRLDRLPANGR